MGNALELLQSCTKSLIYFHTALQVCILAPCRLTKMKQQAYMSYQSQPNKEHHPISLPDLIWNIRDIVNLTLALEPHYSLSWDIQENIVIYLTTTYFSCNWPFALGIHWLLVDSQHKAGIILMVGVKLIFPPYSEYVHISEGRWKFLSLLFCLHLEQ